jgi:tetrahydromethanopterin S-methyltransferase subunit D
MPILARLLTVAFLAGLIRTVLSIIGAYFVYYAGQQFLIDGIRNTLIGGVHGFATSIEAIFYLSGIYDAFAIVLSALTFRLTMQFTRRLAVFF